MNSSTCSSFLQTTTVRMDGILRHPHFTTPPAFYAPSKTALTIQGDLHILLLGTKHYTYSFTHTSYTAISLSFVYQLLCCVHECTCTCYKPQNRNKPPEWIYCTLEASGQKIPSLSSQLQQTHFHIPCAEEWTSPNSTKTTRNAIWCCKRPSKLKKLRF